MEEHTRMKETERSAFLTCGGIDDGTVRRGRFKMLGLVGTVCVAGRQVEVDAVERAGSQRSQRKRVAPVVPRRRLQQMKTNRINHYIIVQMKQPPQRLRVSRSVSYPLAFPFKSKILETLE